MIVNGRVVVALYGFCLNFAIGISICFRNTIACIFTVIITITSVIVTSTCYDLFTINAENYTIRV